jgi:hypothetical protein
VTLPRARTRRHAASRFFLLIQRELASENSGLDPPALPLTSELQVVNASDHCAYGTFQGVLLVNWRREVTQHDVKAVVAYRNQLLKRSFAGAIHMAEPGLPLPDQEGRRLARLGMESRTANRSAVALVIFGTGFAASAIRSLGTAIFSLRMGPPTRICANATDAAAWLVAQTADKVEVEALARACEALRQAGLALTAREPARFDS